MDTTQEYIELEFAWNDSQLDEWQRMACFPDEFRKWIPIQISLLRDKKYRLGNELKLEKDRGWREVFQARIQEQIDELNKHLRILDLPKKIKDGFIIDINIIKQIPIQNFYIGKLIKAGQLFKGKCPFHADKRPSFFIYPTNTWHCFGCDAGRDIIDFVMKQQNCDFQTAVKFLTH